jgi:ABC-type transport system involved in cytochrome c biogenesis permease subunit
MFSTTTLAATLLLFVLGSTTVLLSLIRRDSRLQRLALGFMVAGFVAQTLWIGGICVRTKHPPLTNLPEIAAFLAWTILLVQFALFFRYRVQAAAFFVYPLALLLMTVSALVHEHYAPLDASLRSNLFVAHLFLSTVGVAALLVGLAFALLYHLQQRSLKSKRRGPLYDWIPSLSVCEVVSYRALAIGFAIYTVGLLAGVVWSYRTTTELFSPRAKEIGALLAWILSAVLLQSYISGSHRSHRTIVVSAAMFISIVIAIFGIRHA